MISEPPVLNRRDFLRRGVLAGGAALAAPMINRGRFELYAGSRAKYSRRTLDLIRESIVIDMLGLVTLDWDKLSRWQREPRAFCRADFRKLRDSGITVFHPAVDLNTPDVFVAICDWMRNWNTFLGNHPQQFMHIQKASDLDRAKRNGKIGIILGLQNSSHFRTLEDIEYFYSLGQRVSQLTYNSGNPIGDGCAMEHDAGLTAYGVSVIAAMNRLGMAVDVSHSGDYTTLDAINASTRPVLITHSNCRSLNPLQPRCKPDYIIRRMAARGGVMGITAIRGFVRCGEEATVEDVLDHFDHVASITGIEHLGIGSDNDLDGRYRGGYQEMDIAGLDDPLRVFELTEGLVRRGYSNRHISLVLSGNFRRVLADIWRPEGSVQSRGE